MNPKAKWRYFDRHRKRDLLFLTPLILLLCILSCRHTPLVSKEPPPPSAKKIFIHPKDKPVVCPTEVIFDLSKEQVFSPWDTGFMGYSDLSIMLLKSGFWVSSNSRSLLELLEEISEDTIIVFGVAKGHSVFTEEELSGLEAYVRNGGSLLILGEHDNMFGSSDFQNPLMERFGLRFDPVAVVSQQNKDQASKMDFFWPWFSSGPWHISDIRFFLPGVIATADPDDILAMTDETTLPGHAVLAILQEVGKGRVVACADAEFLWNGNDVMGLKVGNNMEFIRRIFLWLAQKEIPKRHVFDPPPVHSSRVRGRVLFDLQDCAREPDHSGGGLYQLARAFETQGYEVFSVHEPLPDYGGFSLVIIPWPLSQGPAILKEKGRLLFDSARRVLLLGEAHSSFQAIIQHDVSVLEGTPFLNFQDPSPPLNGIAEAFNIMFQPYTVMEGEENFLLRYSRLGTFVFQILKTPKPSP